MAYKILTKNGIDNSNIDGARGEYFNSGMRDGIVQGSLNEGLFIANASNSISFDSCELRIAGHRIVIDEPVYHTFTNAPSTDTRYAFVAQIIVDDNQNVDFSLFVQTANTPLIQNDLYKTITGAGTYQIEIGRFTLLTTLTIEDVVRTIDVITGGSGKNGSGGINVGNVITEKIEPEFDVEVDIDTRYEEDENKEYIDFKFSLPIDMTDTINKSNQALSNSQQAIETANNASSVANGIDGKATQALTNSQTAVETANNANETANEALEQVVGNLGTKVYVNNELQSTLNFDSDPQTEINNKQPKTISVCVKPNFNNWFTKTWNGLTDFSGFDIWTDGENIYYSKGSEQYVLDKSTSTWTAKTWNGYTNFSGKNIWTDGENIYYSFGVGVQYVLDKATSTWNIKIWNGFTRSTGNDIWTDGENIYCSNGSSSQYVLDKATSTWNVKTWNGFTNFSGDDIWTDGENIYYSKGSEQYVLDKSTSTWTAKTWNGLTDFDGEYVWTDGENIYCSNGSSSQYVLDKATSTWNVKTWNGLTDFSSYYIWTDGENIYYSNGSEQYILIYNISPYRLK